MYCYKCGKEVEDNSKFCSYCGNKFYGNVERKKQCKKNGITVVIIICVIVLCIILGCAFLLFGKNKTETKDFPIKKNTPQTVKETALEEQAEYPKEIMLDTETQEKLIEFFEILAHVNSLMLGSESGKYFSESNKIDDFVAYGFILCSLDSNIPFIDGETAEIEDGFWNVPKEAMDIYLENSIGTTDIGEETELKIFERDNVKIYVPAILESAYFSKTLQIEKVLQISDTEIQVNGTVEYDSEWEFEPYTAGFDVILEVNPDSVWGGYSLKKIVSWKDVDDSSDEAGDDNWKQAYIDYIKPKELFEWTTSGCYKELMEEQYDKDMAYALWDINQDGIPEVFCIYDYDTASSGIVLSYDKESGSVVENPVYRRFYYNGTKLRTESGHGGVEYSAVYSLNTNGRLQKEFEISCSYSDEATYYKKDSVEITKEEYQSYKESYSEPIEMEFTYGEIIQQIREYNSN